MDRADQPLGGSDHTTFAGAGVPSLLNWHFTDRFYHTNQDTIDKVSAIEMEHVGVTVAASAYTLASATPEDALVIVGLIQDAAVTRLALERRQGADLVAIAKDRAAADRIEAEVMAAWIKWYGEALDSVAPLPAAGAPPELLQRIENAKRILKPDV